MSLKGFHLFFITIAALFCAAFGIWALFFNGVEGGVVGMTFGVLTLASSIVLAIYGIHFFRKIQSNSSLN